MKVDEAHKPSTYYSDSPNDVVCLSVCSASAMAMTKTDLPKYHFGQLVVLAVAVGSCGLLLVLFNC